MTSHYAPPQSDVADVSRTNTGGITAGMIDAMRGTKPWVLLIGIALLISAAFMALGTVGMIAVESIGAAKAGTPPGLMTGMAAMYAVGCVIYIIMGIYLTKYSSAISRLLQSSSATDMEDALVSQQKFWRFAGVMTAVALVMAAVGFIAAMVIPFLALMK